MNQNDNFLRYLLIVYSVLASAIIIYVLFKFPQPGVADQGDFDRVMIATGLKLSDKYITDVNFDRFLNYLVTDYKIPALGLGRMLIGAVATSMAYLIAAVSLLCKILGQDILKTSYLAAAYSLIYFCSIFIIVKYINIRNKALLSVFIMILLFVLMDGNYLVWFNSLYGEPMMISMLTLYIAAWVYYIYYKDIFKDESKAFERAVFILIAAILFLGSKMQVISSLPIIILMLVKLLRETRGLVSRRKFIVLCILFTAAVLYPLQIGAIFSGIGKDTKYNSVFYGVLKDSKTPRQDLIDLGLNPDMAVEAGKHSYLDKKEYVKYIPHTELTEEEFYSKMSNSKLVKFYITHPLRLIRGMEYTAGHAFVTGTSLGKYVRSYSERPVREFNRFTIWSELREKVLPKNLTFIAIVYLAVFGISAAIYFKNKHDRAARDRMQLLWAVAFIGILQFPMPFMGNGQADTTKQLYLFDFTFDIILIFLFCWCFNKLFFSKKITSSWERIKNFTRINR